MPHSCSDDSGGASRKGPPGASSQATKKRHDWMVMYNALVAFGVSHGHCNVPLRHERVMINEVESVQLGAWLATQRRENVANTMKLSRKVLMQKLVDDGLMEWAPLNHSKQSEKTWPLMYECLKLYCLEHRALGKTVTTIPEGLMWTHPNGIVVGLGRWMHTQNKQRRAGRLRADRTELMEIIIKSGLYRWPPSRSKVKASKEESSIEAPPNTDGGGDTEFSTLNYNRDYGEGQKFLNIADDDKKTGDHYHHSKRRRYNPSLKSSNSSASLLGKEDDLTLKKTKEEELGGVSHAVFANSHTIISSGSHVASVGVQLQNSVLNSSFVDSSRNTQIPLTTDTYARKLAAEYFSVDRAEEVSLIYPLPQFRLQSSTVAPRLGRVNMQQTSLIVADTEPSPQLITVQPNSQKVTDDIKYQIQAQTIVYLAMQKSSKGGISSINNFVKSLASYALCENWQV